MFALRISLSSVVRWLLLEWDIWIGLVLGCCLPCITPTMASISTFSFPTRRRYFTLVWSFFKTVIVSSGTPYFFRIFHSNSRMTESYAFTRSTNSTCVSCPCSQSCSSAFFSVKVASTHPFPNNDPHCLSIPNLQRCCVSWCVCNDQWYQFCSNVS